MSGIWVHWIRDGNGANGSRTGKQCEQQSVEGFGYGGSRQCRSRLIFLLPIFLSIPSRGFGQEDE